MTNKVLRDVLEAILDNSRTEIETTSPYVYAQDAALCTICEDPECWGNYSHYES